MSDLEQRIAVAEQLREKINRRVVDLGYCNIQNTNMLLDIIKDLQAELAKLKEAKEITIRPGAT